MTFECHHSSLNIFIDEKIVEPLRQHLGHLKLVYLFGSYVSGDATPTSDLDIAIKSGIRISYAKRTDIAGILSDELKVEVDLIDLSEADDTLKIQVISKGKRLFASSGLIAAEFEMYALSDYVKLNELRKELIENFYR